jgi:hypothetical protein
VFLEAVNRGDASTAAPIASGWSDPLLGGNLNRNALFTARNAMANFVGLAGKVQVAVQAESPGGFDRSKLRNGVLEPLRETDLID